jgi:hypothetical protein
LVTHGLLMTRLSSVLLGSRTSVGNIWSGLWVASGSD